MEYVAFISYRHLPLDKAVAQKLSRQIERFVIPKRLRKSYELPFTADASLTAAERFFIYTCSKGVYLIDPACVHDECINMRGN